MSIPKVTEENLLLIFKDFSNLELLEKCLYDQTKNIKKLLNGVIMQKCPIKCLVSRQVLELQVSSVVLQYNDGYRMYFYCYGTG